MGEQTRVSRLIYGLLPTDVEGFDSLGKRANPMAAMVRTAEDKTIWQIDDGNHAKPA